MNQSLYNLKKIIPPPIKRIIRLCNNIPRRLQRAFTRPFGYNPGVPHIVQIEVTTRCNLSCIMCPRETLGFKKRNIPDMSIGEFKDIIEKVPKGVRSIIICGLGEIFLNKDILEMISAASAKSPVTLVTNGTLLNEKLIYDLFNAPLAGIEVSMDYPRKEGYEKVRIGANYENLVKNIIRLSEVKKKFSTRVWLSIAMVMLEENFNYINDMIDLCAEWGVGSMGLLRNSDPGSRNISEDIPEYQEKMRRIEQHAEDKKVSLYLGDGVVGYKDKTRRRLCGRPWRTLSIGCDGTVNPCCVYPSTERQVLGNIFEADFQTAWNGSRMRAFRRALASKNNPEMCRSCKLLYREVWQGRNRFSSNPTAI